MLEVKTPLGTLRASESDYYDHPGIWIELKRLGEHDFNPLVLVEYTDDDDGTMKAETIITRVWRNPEEDEFSTAIEHENTTLPEKIDGKEDITGFRTNNYRRRRWKRSVRRSKYMETVKILFWRIHVHMITDLWSAFSRA